MSERAIVDLIGNFDKGFTGLGAFIERDVKQQSSNRVSPDDIQQSIEDFNDSFSDSGLGSSIASSDAEDDLNFSKRGTLTMFLHFATN
jgi:hypothetical protein